MCNSKVKLFVKSNDIHKGRVYVIDLSNNPNLYLPVPDDNFIDVEKDHEIKLLALASEGYIFLEWHEIQNGVSREIKKSDYSTKVSEDKSYEAIFVPKKYKIDVNVNDSSRGSVKGAGVYEFGQEVTIEAIPKNGYGFDCWNDDESDKTKKKITVKENGTYTAVLKPNDNVKVTIEPNDKDKGSTFPATGFFPKGLEITVKAIAKPGYIFSQWSDGTTCNPKTVQATAGLDIKAIFEKATPRAMFDSLLNHDRKCIQGNKQCPDYEKFDEQSPDDFSKVENVIDKELKSSEKWTWIHWLVSIILAVLIVFLFLSKYDEKEYLESTCCKCCNIDSTSINNTPKECVVSFTPCKCCKTEIPVKISTDDNRCGFIYAHHIIIDTVYSSHTYTAEDVNEPSQPNLQNNTSIHGEIAYRNTSWYILLYDVIIAVLVLIAIVLVIRFFMQYCMKKTDFEHKMIERRYNDYIRLSDEDREYKLLQYKTNVSLFEKREKAIIEEWQQDKEHDRKLDVMEQERIAELSKVLLELAKVKNTVTLSDPKGSGKTVTVEKSVLLSGDCCNELNNVIQGFIKENSHRCKMFEEILKCMSENPVGCEKLRTCLKSFLCDKGDCEGKCKELSECLGKIANAVEKMSCGGTSTVINNCK